ncbi:MULTISPECIES: glycosyltransferase family 2 protein [Olivibacter]|jgi:glycosyltransferase involved in cell wall biosynthesis|uniref:Glycosyltransferase family 2 protein n=1 Tax=Olivibacter oleidegradans TaxID=760123 RepID=A0ABV6HGN0_9SPHI|nr:MULTISPECIES: glycosyltransferase family 2 protein [Olivibacter]MDM8176669.1 glycosyltransferase family 2 protein [Olivibacter sp. 47]QEL00496.1 glycosyltransferase family 2 protein [Olivibacter sp. LS-1]
MTKDMIKKPLVSIIVPVYNRADFIGVTLENLVANQYRPLEIILVDDGSSDTSLSVLERFRESQQNELFTVKVFTQSNQGAPAARNYGFLQAKGAFIQFLDSDDLIDTNKFSEQIHSMELESADFGLCDFQMIYVDTNEQVYHSNAHKLKKVLKTHGSFGCGSPLLRKDLADKISWNVRLKRNQDVDYFLKAALMSMRIAYVPKALYTYVRHSSDRISASYSKTSPVYDERIRSLRQLFGRIPNKFHAAIALMNLYLSLFKFKLTR